MGISFLFSFAFSFSSFLSYLRSLLRQPFCLFAFLFLGDGLDPCLLYNVMNLCPWDFPGNSPGVGCHFLLQGIFLTQGSNPGLLHCRQTLNRLSHQGSPTTVERVDCPFSRGSSQPRNRTGISCIEGQFFTS